MFCGISLAAKFHRRKPAPQTTIRTLFKWFLYLFVTLNPMVPTALPYLLWLSRYHRFREPSRRHFSPRKAAPQTTISTSFRVVSMPIRRGEFNGTIRLAVSLLVPLSSVIEFPLMHPLPVFPPCVSPPPTTVRISIRVVSRPILSADSSGRVCVTVFPSVGALLPNQFPLFP